jgi:dipeptidyl aminopeptidase/acylaminoacyl peptidase
MFPFGGDVERIPAREEENHPMISKHATRLAGIAALAAVVLLPLAAPGQVTRADYERAMGLRAKYERLPVGVAEPASWIEKTHRFTYRRSVKGGFEFVLVDADTGRKQPAFDHARLAAALSKAAGAPYTAIDLPFTSFSFVDGEQAIETRGAAGSGPGWRIRLSDDSVSRAEARFPRGAGGGRGRGRGPIRDLSIPAETAPARSPDGRWEAFLQNYNIAVRRVGETKFTLLSTDGSEGNFFDLETLAWSPDSKKIAVFRVRPGYQRHVEYTISSPEDQAQPKHMSLFYPKPGDAVDIEQPVLLDVEARTQTNIPADLFPNAYDLSEPVWWRDSRGFTFEYNQRGHLVYRVIEVDAAAGKARAVVSEEPETFFSYRPASNNPKETGSRYRYDVNDGKEIIWMSERDGWKQLYLYDGATGRVKNRITRGDWVVRYVLKVDEEKRQIWFAASGMVAGKDPYFHHFYRIDFDGSNLTPLTEADADHTVAFSTDMQYYVDTYSRVDLPTVSELRRTADRSIAAKLETGDITDLLQAGWKAPEVFVAKGRDGRTDIWGIIVRPSRFDPKKKYPVVENIYAGPQGSFVPKSFIPFAPHSAGDSVLGMQSLAELGFIVVMIDGMGTGSRSKAFHDVAWKNIGDAGFADRILWHKAAAAKYPYYDISRVGIYGGSAGGQNSTGAVLFHPEFYRAAVSFAGCHDNRMDKISWNELWMSWPIGPHYAASSNVDNAWRLQGKLLLVVGELDTNVDPASTLQVANALIKANKMFDLLVVPNGGHGAGRTSEVPEYGDRKRFDFFVRHLLGLAPPDWNAMK